jgi:hypothetical protein
MTRLCNKKYAFIFGFLLPIFFLRLKLKTLKKVAAVLFQKNMTGLEGKVLILSSFMDSSVHRQQQLQQQQQQQQQLLQQKQLHSDGLPVDPPAEVATPTTVPENLFSDCETTPEKQRSQKHCCDKCDYKSPHRHALERHNQVVSLHIVSCLRDFYVRNIAEYQ